MLKNNIFKFLILLLFLTGCADGNGIIDYNEPLENLVYKLNSQYNLYDESKVEIDDNLKYSDLVNDFNVNAKLIKNNSYNKKDKTVSIILYDYNKENYKAYEFLNNILLTNGYSVLSIDKREYNDVDIICFDIFANNYSDLRINIFESEDEINYIKNDINNKDDILNNSKYLMIEIENMIKKNQIFIEKKFSTDSDKYIDIPSVSIYIDKNMDNKLYEFSSSIYEAIDNYFVMFN